MTNSEIWMTCLTAVIAVAGVIGACIFINQLGVMQGQLTEMKATSRLAEETLEATQRPWVSIKPGIGPRGLYFDVNGANLDLVFSLKNSGPTPAVSVRIEGAPRIDVGSNDRINALEKVCTEAKAQAEHPRMAAHTIFPGETLDMNITYTFANKEQVALAAERMHGFILPVVIGCVDYFFTFGERRHHQTRFVYDLDCPAPNGGSLAIKVSDGNKPANLLRLRRWLEGGGFQAD